MGLVKLTNGKGIELDHERSLELWNAWTGKTTPTKEQERFLERVTRIYLSWRADDCPDDYLIERSGILHSMYDGTPDAFLVQEKVGRAKLRQDEGILEA